MYEVIESVCIDVSGNKRVCAWIYQIIESIYIDISGTKT